MENDKYLLSTTILDYGSPCIQRIVADRCWARLDEKTKVTSIYNFVRDEIAFGYNIDDNISASEVLKDGFGQCNTKSTLFMALLRAVGVPCRLHGFTIDKKLQKGAQTGLTYLLAPKEIVHSWVEVYFDGKWYVTEGIILDVQYLNGVQSRFSSCNGSFCGYGIATKNFRNPTIDWDGNDTYIQSEGIVRDFGVYDTPDEFYKEHRQNMTPLKKWLFLHIGRKSMNRNVRKMRGVNSVK